jgi:hypothetical protein
MSRRSIHAWFVLLLPLVGCGDGDDDDDDDDDDHGALGECDDLEGEDVGTGEETSEKVTLDQALWMGEDPMHLPIYPQSCSMHPDCEIGDSDEFYLELFSDGSGNQHMGPGNDNWFLWGLEADDGCSELTCEQVIWGNNEFNWGFELWVAGRGEDDPDTETWLMPADVSVGFNDTFWFEGEDYVGVWLPDWHDSVTWQFIKTYDDLPFLNESDPELLDLGCTVRDESASE